MILCFLNSENKSQVLGNPETLQEAHTLINEFLLKANYVARYVNTWVEIEDGIKRTYFDVGSHSEFFTLEE